MGQNIAGGAVAGASGGAPLAGVSNGKRKSVGRGALIAAAAGAAAATDTAARWQQDYNYAYQRCMAATDRRRAPPAGTPAWQDYCSARYRSFDPVSGMYLSYSGSYKPCR
ncbi:MAG: BA14K family protein [Pseudomonadota bacterium]|nr:BA14K family protein [Pseudomonadota bacterium]